MGTGGNFGVMEMSVALVMVSLVYIYPQTH